MNLKAKMMPTKANLSCMSCVKDHEVLFNEPTKESWELSKKSFGNTVLKGAECEMCGCNTFNIDMYYETHLEIDEEVQ